MSKGLILLAAGGTGGHMFPAEATARALLARGWSVRLVTDRRGKAFGDALPEISVERIHAASGGRTILSKLRAVGELALGTVEAAALIRRLRPAAVVGFGGYPAAPTCFAAARAGLPLILHEQNAVLGRANRMAARRASAIATSFETVAGIPAGVRAVFTGNPVRAGFVDLRDAPYRAPQADEPFDILVMGGSLGATIFAEILPAALAQLDESLRRRIRLTQQSRPENLDSLRESLRSLLDDFEAARFFEDVPQRMARCHLVVSRAGASTAAELATIGRPAILVPYPHAMDDHQTANAKAMADAGAGWLAPQPQLTPEGLAQRIAALAADPAALTQAAAAAHGRGVPDAAARLAELVEQLASARSGGSPGQKVMAA